MNRPTIDFNGTLVPMNDEQFAEYTKGRQNREPVRESPESIRLRKIEENLSGLDDKIGRVLKILTGGR